MASYTATIVSPEKGGAPVRSPCKTAPKDQMSARASAPRAERICSGAM